MTVPMGLVPRAMAGSFNAQARAVFNPLFLSAVRLRMATFSLVV